MTDVRIGSLFSGMGGLDLGVQAVLGARVAWTCEVDPAASNILAHHWPEVPNLGDITKVDWPSVEPIDVLVGGFPCQDISNAGLRAGIHGGRSGLWTHMLNAIEWLDPKLVVIENVSALRSARSEFSEEVRVPGPRGGSRLARTHRALGVVLADLAGLGYDARWGSVRAADVGAPHRRERCFILAHPCGQGPQGSGQAASAGWAGAAVGGGEPLTLLPSPHANATTGAGRQGRDGGMNLQTAVALLPTPAVNDMGAGKTVEGWDQWTDDMRAKHGNGNGHGRSLAIEAQRLLPTPVGTDSLGAHHATSTRPEGSKHHSGTTLSDLTFSGELLPTPLSVPDSPASHHQISGTFRTAMTRALDNFGRYAPAIARWEQILGRPAPSPTRDDRLSPVFVEWMMGLPEGHVTGLGLTKTQQLKILGNGVVPQQAALALELLLVGAPC